MLTDPSQIEKIAEQLFRQESGRMVSVLTKIFGTENLEIAEDVVQETMLNALHTWKLKGIPDNPSAWLFRVAKNNAIDSIRRKKHSINFDFSDSGKILLTSEYTITQAMENLWKEELIKDDQLRMMYVCCHPEVSVENQITLILKILCGFSTAEIAQTFLIPEDTVSKRLYRTKEFFRQKKIKFQIPSVNDLKNRTDAVLNSIYLLFNEGYNSTHSTNLIRKNLIEEALTLCKLLIENPYTKQPEAFALMALMCFHASRTESRISPEGEIVLLPKQDRSKWDYQLISKGNDYMNQAAYGNTVSAYHVEAAIAFEHCTSEDFEKTNWNRVLELYDLLLIISPSPVAELNRVVAILKARGVLSAYEAIESISDKKKLQSFYLYHSLSGEIYSLLDRKMEAVKSFEKAIRLTESPAERKLLKEKIAALLE